MILNIETTYRPEEYRSEVYDRLTALAQREYRRVSKSRRQTYIFRWNVDSWCSDGSYSLLRGTLIGNDVVIRHTNHGAPVLAEVNACLRRA